MVNVAGEQLLFLTNSDCHEFYFFFDGASDLAILIFSTCFFHFWHLLSYSP